MSAVKAIYQAPKTYSQDGNVTVAMIKYNGHCYYGMATLNDETKDFGSKKVGQTIALSRARQNALKNALANARYTAKVKTQMYNEVTAYGQKSPAEVDSLGAFKLNMERAQLKVKDLEQALKAEKQGLNNYLAGLKEAITSIKRMRGNQDKDS